MPRKRLDPAAEVLAYFMETSYDVALVMLGLVKGAMAKRAPVVEKKVRKPWRKKQQVVVQEPAFSQAHGLQEQPAPELVTATPAAPKIRKRRMRADSPAPVSEATPIVPQQDEVGELEESYVGD